MASNSADPVTIPAATDDHATRLAVDVRRLPWIRKLAADYVFDFAAVTPFFNGNPTVRTAWQDAIARAHAHTHPHAEVAAVIAEQQGRRHAPAPAVAAGAKLADPHTVAIVTGQQAGLFGGPLFTLLKALTAIKLAETVQRDYQVPAVAVFWIEAEDHDWNEVRSLAVFDKEQTARTVSLPSRPPHDVSPVGSVCLDQSIVAALDELEATLSPTEFRDALMHDLREAYAPGVRMADAFGRWLERVLGGHGLVVYDGADPATKPLVRGIFRRELSTPGETGRLATASGHELTTRGYHAQVQSLDDSVALFHLDGGRRPIRQERGDFVIGETRHTAASVLALAADHPEMFSPNVLMRPIVQDTLFPTVGYVAGPNELAYLGQLKRVYERFSVPMPLLVQRASATIADAATLRFLQKYHLPFESLQGHDESILNQLLAAQIPAVVEESFVAATKAIEEQMTRLIEAMPSLDPTLEGAARSTLGKMQHDLTTLHSKTIQAAKRRDETLRRQFLRARAITFPDGQVQERAIGFISFLNQYGPALIDRLNGQLPLDPRQHWVVTL